MQKSAYLRVIVAGLLLGGFGSASACGGSSNEDEDNGGSSGSAGKGSGGMDASTPGPVECGTQMCEPFIIPIPGAPPVEACCAANGDCGLDSSVLEAFGPTFEERCQPLNQPGEIDPSCPNSTSTMLDGGFTIELPGCCRANGRCGYMLDTVITFEVGLGCVDSSPFLEGGTPAPCGDGAGGAPSDGGAPGDPGTGGASGATSAGGAGGAPSGGGAGGA